MLSIAYDFTPETAAGEFLRKPHQLLIDGHRVPSSSGRTFKSLNPATEEVIATIAEGNEADVNRAVAAARRAFEGPWRTMRAAQRGNLLLKWAELLKRHADEIIEIESLDGGKPISATTRQDFPAAIDTLTYYAGSAATSCRRATMR
jgi:aldehyde dehydrogenase (NAD+)